MNIYRITVREISSIEYSVEADSKEEARDLIGMGNQQVATNFVVDWYAVIIWTPEELGNVSANWVEEMSISYGCEYLIPQEEDVA